MESIAQPAKFSPGAPDILSLLVFTALVAAVLALLLFLAGWLGEKKLNREKIRAYECGVIPTGRARFRYPVPFYLVAIFFLIFDVEAAYIFSWAIAWENLGWAGWLQICFFVVVLLLSLFYIWQKGGLDWGPSAKRRVPAPPDGC